MWLVSQCMKTERQDGEWILYTHSRSKRWRRTQSWQFYVDDILIVPSWEEVKEHTLRVLRNWEFTGWDTMFAALADGEVIGMASLAKEDYYPLPDIFPWVSSVFVTEAYRGQRISAKLVDFANAYAKSLGFERTYIPSEHIGLYEKYGYSYVRDIVNYGGGTDRLYVKELK